METKLRNGYRLTFGEGMMTCSYSYVKVRNKKLYEGSVCINEHKDDEHREEKVDTPKKADNLIWILKRELENCCDRKSYFYRFREEIWARFKISPLIGELERMIKAEEKK